MPRPPILQPDESYTFSRYFELTFDPEDILAELGCILEQTLLYLPRHSGELPVHHLKHRLEEDLSYVALTSETARREVIIAPVLLEVCRHTQAKLKIEYPITVSNWLKGSVDYYLQAKNNLLVIEAKNADLTRGFTQLAVELIALNQWSEQDTATLYGAVTTGDIWKFGLMHRQEKRIVQDINLYRVPADLEDVLSILVGLLGSVTL